MSMKTTKYIDLAGRIAEDQGAWAGLPAIRSALDWLDRNPSQAPGRTITESEVLRITGNTSDKYARGVQAGLIMAGVAVIPDPVPTNAQKLQAMLELWTDEYDGSPETFPEYLDRMGVKAPGAAA